MVEIITRKEGELSQKESIQHEQVQVSYNDWGHVCIRGFGKGITGITCRASDETRKNCSKSLCTDNCAKCKEFYINADDEHLIVFDKETSDRIIRFIRQAKIDIPF